MRISYIRIQHHLFIKESEVLFVCVVHLYNFQFWLARPNKYVHPNLSEKLEESVKFTSAFYSCIVNMFKKIHLGKVPSQVCYLTNGISINYIEAILLSIIQK